MSVVTVSQQGGLCHDQLIFVRAACPLVVNHRIHEAGNVMYCSSVTIRCLLLTARNEVPTAINESFPNMHPWTLERCG